MIRFKLFGINIEFSFGFFAVITALIYIDKTGVVLPAMGASLLHEAAHIFAMRFYGYKFSKVSVKIGSAVIYGRFAQTIKEEIIINAAGPILNLLLGLLMWFLYNFLNYNILLIFSVVNFGLGIFNLLPVMGLDGHTVLYNILVCKKGVKVADKICIIISITICLILFIIGIALFFLYNHNLSLIIISLYLFIGILLNQ